MDPEDAFKFITHFSKKENYSNFNKIKPPIIEYSIEDIRKTKKLELAVAAKKKERHQEAKNKQKTQELNKKTHTYKLLIEDILNNNESDPKSLEKIKEFMKNIRSRGIKQRLNKRIVSQFGEEAVKKPEMKQIEGVKKKIVKEKNKKNMKTTQNAQNNKNLNKKKDPQITKEELKNKIEIKKIVETQKKKNKLKRNALENDEFDVFLFIS